jgi:hypothetical protein
MSLLERYGELGRDGTFSIVGATMPLFERYGELGRYGTLSIVGATIPLLERYGELGSTYNTKCSVPTQLSISFE